MLFEQKSQQKRHKLHFRTLPCVRHFSTLSWYYKVSEKTFFEFVMMDGITAHINVLIVPVPTFHYKNALKKWNFSKSCLWSCFHSLFSEINRLECFCCTLSLKNNSVKIKSSFAFKHKKATFKMHLDKSFTLSENLL